MPMLECYERIALQFAYVLQVRVAARVITKHPANMGKPKTTTRAIWILLGIVNKSMMHAMAGAPYQCTILQGHGTEQEKESYKRYLPSGVCLRAEMMHQYVLGPPFILCDSGHWNLL